MGLPSSNSRSRRDSAAVKRGLNPGRFNLDKKVMVEAECTIVGMAIPVRSTGSDEACRKESDAWIMPHANSEFSMTFPCRVTIYLSGGSALGSHFYKCIGHANNGFDRGLSIHVAVGICGRFGTVDV